MRRDTDTVKCYQELIKRQQETMTKLSNVGREKDYKVQKIEKKYEAQIDDLVRELEAIDLQIDVAKRYVGCTSCEKAEIIKKVNKKEKD